MKRSKSSRRWLSRHHRDDYVKRAQVAGYRSRAAFKLLEINDKDHLIRPGQVVVDLGAAPGGWSQVAAKLVGPGGLVVALDILPMDPLPGVICIEGDFREETVLAALRQQLGAREVDLVISDMAPNVSGIPAVDQPRAMHLCELALEFSRNALKKQGDLLIKVFQGEGFDEFFREVHRSFAKVHTRKPRASRTASREVYLVARGFRKD
ncbi:MAG: 23S rRNA (uridine(2552)-2'-O)-methyltransferase RlmE [Pseudomonadota bacterium]